MKSVKNHNAKLLLIPFLITLFYCSEQKEPDLEKYSKVYVNLLIVDQMYSTEPDSVELHRDLVFKSFDISEDDYKAEIDKLGERSEVWEKFFSLSLTYLDSLKKSGAVQ